MVKEFLSLRGVDYIERDVSIDAAAFDELSALGAMTTPITVIDDVVVIGFDKNRLETLLD